MILKLFERSHSCLENNESYVNSKYVVPLFEKQTTIRFIKV